MIDLQVVASRLLMRVDENYKNIEKHQIALYDYCFSLPVEAAPKLTQAFQQQVVVRQGNQVIAKRPSQRALKHQDI